MDPRQTSFDLLAHFDRPKTVESPDFEWDETPCAEAVETARDTELRLQTFNEELRELRPATKRGVVWLLTWAAAVAVLAFSSSVLAEFAYMLTAEHKLALAARTGVLEATLPRATFESVTATTMRRLTAYPLLTKQLQLTLMQNGSPVQHQFRQADGDHFSITLSAPISAVVPAWVRTIMPWRSESSIQAHAERQIPGRKPAFGAGLLTPPK
jgi:hypothetical protein